MSNRPALMGPEDVAETASSLSLLAEYTHVLDTLPIDLSRNFADLRELDAVLSSSMQAIGGKITRLTEMVQQGQGSKEERLWLLSEISEDANRLKLGGEDKIRVTCQAADNLRHQSNHLREMAIFMPRFNPDILIRNTVYPHVSAVSHPPANTHEHGRRRKVTTQGSCLPMGAPDPSPHKRKRVVRDDDDPPRNSRKEKPNDGRARNGRKKQDRERAHSPAESQVSVTSYSHPAGQSSSRGGPSSKRFKNGPVNGHSYVPYDHYTPYDPILTNGSRRGPAAPDMTNLPPATHHPSIPIPAQNGSTTYRYDAPSMNGDWDHPGQGLEGPGMPMARNGSGPASHASAPVPHPDDNDADPDGEMDDGKTYCFCERVSYGQMIACDDQKCEREWFHLECIGLSAPPEGRWFCDACKQKKNTRTKATRGGKRKGMGRGANGRAAAAGA